jgi:hypothetical protein
MHAVTTIGLEEDTIRVDATIVAKGIGIDPALVLERMREGKLTSRCERGIEEDAGRYRLTFFLDNRRFRLIIDDRGNVVQRSTLDFGDRRLPASARKP